MNDNINAAYKEIDRLKEQLEAHHQTYSCPTGQGLLDLAITQLQNLTAAVLGMEEDFNERMRRCEYYSVPAKYRPTEDADEAGHAKVEGEDATAGD